MPRTLTDIDRVARAVAAKYPQLPEAPTIEWGPGYEIALSPRKMGDPADAALILHRAAFVADVLNPTVATLEVALAYRVTDQPPTLFGIELTIGDLVTLRTAISALIDDVEDRDDFAAIKATGFGR